VEGSGLFQVSKVEMHCTERPVDLGQRVVDVPLLVAAKMSNSHVASHTGDLVRDSSVLTHWLVPLHFNTKSAAEKQEEKAKTETFTQITLGLLCDGMLIKMFQL